MINNIKLTGKAITINESRTNKGPAAKVKLYIVSNGRIYTPKVKFTGDLAKKILDNKNLYLSCTMSVTANINKYKIKARGVYITELVANSFKTDIEDDVQSGIYFDGMILEGIIKDFYEITPGITSILIGNGDDLEHQLNINVDIFAPVNAIRQKIGDKVLVKGIVGTREKKLKDESINELRFISYSIKNL